MNHPHFIGEKTKAQRGGNSLKIPGLVNGLADILVNVSLTPLAGSFNFVLTPQVDIISTPST